MLPLVPGFLCVTTPWHATADMTKEWFKGYGSTPPDGHIWDPADDGLFFRVGTPLLAAAKRGQDALNKCFVDLGPIAFVFAASVRDDGGGLRAPLCPFLAL